MSEFIYRAASSDADLAGYARTVVPSYAMTERDALDYASRSAPGSVRVLEVSGRVVAGMRLLRMGQYFGGRSVPMIGIQAVATAPEARGSGAAAEMMRRAVLEFSEEGVPLTALYASTQALYRKVGYEQAGHRFELRLPLRSIEVAGRHAEDDAVRLRPMEEADRDSVRALYSRVASAMDGFLDRDEGRWSQVENRPPARPASEEPSRAYVVEGERGVEGYIFLVPQRLTMSNARHDVVIRDMAATTARAGRRLWRFLANFSTLGHDAVWAGPPTHPLLQLLRQQSYTMALRDHWMIRITDAAAALRARGYPLPIDTAFPLVVTDPLVERNNAALHVRVRDGRAEVERTRTCTGSGGEGGLELDITALSSVYSGYMTPAQMALIGRVRPLAGDADLGRVGAVFAGGVPGMPDHF